MNKRNAAIAAICVAAASVGTWFSLRKKDKTPRIEQSPFIPENSGQSYDQPFEEDEVPQVKVDQDNSVAQTHNDEESERAPRVNSPFFEEAIRLAIEEDPDAEKREFVNPNYFYHPQLSIFFSSRHPIIRIVPSSRYDEYAEKKVQANRLDILFPVPQALVMEDLDLGKFHKLTGLTVLPGKGTKLDARAFYYAFGGNKRAGDKRVEYMGYIPKILSDCLPYYPQKDIEVRKEGYINVSYLMYDPRTRRYVRQHKLYCGTNSEALKDALASSDNGKDRDRIMNQYLTEVFEKYAMSEEVITIPENIVDPNFLEPKRPDYIRKEETEIDDVMLVYRVSFFLNEEEDYPGGITPYGLSKILLLMSTKLDINEKYDDPDEKRYKWLKPWIIEEWPDKKGELNVLNLVNTGENTFDLQAIPMISRRDDSLVESMVNDKYLKK